MLQKVYVNGYRSLEDIEIPIQAGLNILVGPNGGGKTNILSFFEFLSKLSDSQVDEAVSSHGGIGRVFTRLQDNVYRTNLDCAISGSSLFTMRGGDKKILWYTWKFQIIASENYDEIQYGSQSLYINVNKEPRRPEDSDLILTTRRTDSGFSAEIKNLVASRLQHLFRGFEFLNIGTYLSKADASRFLLGYIRHCDLARSCLVTSFPRQMTVFRLVGQDISGGEIFNFVPEVCKQPEDSARPPVIEKDGAGLASTLHRLGKPTPLTAANIQRFRFRRSITGEARLKRIISYVNLINPSVTGLRTEKNPIDNTISVYISIKEKDGSVAFPLAQSSDGTVKWIALLTKVITAEAGFSIEEPENFLHPAVQKEFLHVVRTESSNHQFSPYTLVTTHSESLLNEAKPAEVILVWMEDGRTIARRVSNIDQLVNEINRTGFGLGHYYTSGALEGA